MSFAAVDKHVASIESILKRILEEVRKARDENDVPKLNCLIPKVNQVRGYLQAAQRAKLVLLEVASRRDQAAGLLYARRIEGYAESAETVWKSVDECVGAQVLHEGTTMIYIRPEGEAEDEPSPMGPWDSDEILVPDGLPVVPPASPFR